MKIESWPLAKIRPYEKNPRVNDAAVEAVARSIQEFGFRDKAPGSRTEPPSTRH